MIAPRPRFNGGFLAGGERYMRSNGEVMPVAELVDVGQCGGLVFSGGERDHMADVHHVHEVSEIELGKLFSFVAARADTDDADEAEAA